MSNLSDVNIFDSIKRGDAPAFSQLFHKYYASLCFYSYNFTKDMDLSRSIVQQVFVDIWIKKHNFNIVHSVKPYLYKSVKHKTIDFMRQRNRSLSVNEEFNLQQEVPFRDLMHEAEIQDLLNKSINKLPKKCREIFLLCRVEELKYKEIAAKLNISVKTVEMQMGIALKKLSAMLIDQKVINLFLVFFSKKKS